MTKVYRLKNLDCANCAAKMERAIGKIEGVTSAQISFMTQRLTLEADEEKLSEVLEKAKACIAKIEPECTIVGA